MIHAPLEAASLHRGGVFTLKVVNTRIHMFRECLVQHVRDVSVAAVMALISCRPEGYLLLVPKQLQLGHSPGREDG